jgi:hypothetical protein
VSTVAATTDLRIARGFALPLDLVTEATAIVATRGAGKSSASAVIVEEAFALGVQTVVFDRTGVYWGLRSSRDGDGPGLGIYVLGGPHGDVPLEATAGKFTADLVVDSGHSFVLDLSDFSKADAVKFSAAFLEHLYDRKAQNRTTLLVVMDEAHFYAPQAPRGGFKGDSAKLMGAMEDVVGLGRSRGLGVVLTTQRTQALNKAVLDLIETLLVMRMLSPRAREAVRAWIQEKHEEDKVGVIASLDSLPTGTAWVWSPLRGILQRVALRRIKSFDSYATPRPGEARAEPTKRKELDLAALGEQMAATAERAKENDPAELRRRIRDLERTLSQAPATGPAAETVEVRVEVPVVSEEAAALAREAVDEIRHLAKTIEVTLSFIPEKLGPLAEALARGEAVEKRAERTPVGVPARAREGVREREAVTAAPAKTATPSAGTNGALGPAARLFLETMARFYPMPLTLGQLGLLADRKTRGGSFNTAMRELRDGDYIADEGGLLVLTDKGADTAGVDSVPMTLDRWRDVLPPAALEILDVVADEGAAGITTDEISARTGRAPRGGSWNTALKMLTQSGTIERSGDRLVLAEEYR